MSNEAEVFKYAHDVVDEMVKYHLGEFLFYGLAGGALYVWGKASALHTLHSGKLNCPTAVIQTTSYDPAYTRNGNGQTALLINEKTGNNFRDQKIRTEEVPINLGELFDKKISKELVGYFNRAAKLASKDSPVVYSHLQDVLPEKDSGKIQELIRNSMQNYISGLYRDTEKMLATSLAPNQCFETNKILPVLVREDGAIGWQLRILLLKLNEEGGMDLPDEHDVRYLMPDGSYAPGDESVEIDRYQTLKAIQKGLETPEIKSQLMQYVVEIPTGNITTIQGPLLTPAPSAAP